MTEPVPPATTREWRNVDTKILREEILPRERPAVMKGLVADWPIVRAAAQSPQALHDYVRARDLGRPVRLMLGRPEIKGVYFYRDDLHGLNFDVASQPFHATLAQILACGAQPDAPAMYTGATPPLKENFPRIAEENTLGILERPANPRLWLGNAVTAATHYDNMEGINCVVAGRKRFTFFPPDQLPNLYIGPLDLSPGGQPTSMVRLAAPDFERYPRFAQALDAAETADLEPGDAVFIPGLWWHNVESLDALNMSMNFWWSEPAEWAAEPFAALAHGLLAMAGMPPARREIWRRMFDHYVFQSGGDPVPYLPPDRRGMLGTLFPALESHMRVQIMRSLTKRMPKALGEQIRRLLSPSH